LVIKFSKIQMNLIIKPVIKQKKSDNPKGNKYILVQEKGKSKNLFHSDKYKSYV
jgi:hypothetical protein